ncbi:MAG: hypothetical protein J6A79_05930, partial [Clostridia bacterium]|nr:hypothetical protein [Clostridia bacterium]
EHGADLLGSLDKIQYNDIVEFFIVQRMEFFKTFKIPAPLQSKYSPPETVQGVFNILFCLSFF